MPRRARTIFKECPVITVYGLKAFMPALKGVVRDMRVVWALEELGEKYERKVMDARTQEHKQPDYLAINPFGKVPTIRDGEFCLFESAAILTYLGDKHGKLVPKAGTRERAIYNQWVSYSISTFEPFASRVFRHDYFIEKKDPATMEIRKECVDALSAFMGVLDGVFSKQDYILGAAFSMADIHLAGIALYVKQPNSTRISNAAMLARHSSVRLKSTGESLRRPWSYSAWQATPCWENWLLMAPVDSVNCKSAWSLTSSKLVTTDRVPVIWIFSTLTVVFSVHPLGISP
jgi:glutathione S-transferase